MSNDGLPEERGQQQYLFAKGHVKVKAKIAHFN